MFPNAQIVEESDGTVKATAPAKPGASPEQQMKDAVAAGALAQLQALLENSPAGMSA